jgi:L-lactate dehydrogenase
VVPPIVAAAPNAVILVATDPPDPLTDVVQNLAPGVKVFGTGTWLDSLRFRVHLAEELGVSPRSIQADVLGEHGKSEVLHWSGATVGNVPWQDVVAQRGLNEQAIKARVDEAVRLANINIIKGIGASQYGIGIVIARLIEAVLHNEKLVAPVGSHCSKNGVTFSLPSVIGAAGVEEVFSPRLDAEEQDLLKNSIGVLQSARDRILAQHSAQ